MGGVVGGSKLGEIQNNRTRNKKRQVEGAEGWKRDLGQRGSKGK